MRCEKRNKTNFKCGTNPKEFHLAKELKQHPTEVNLETNRFQCSLCSKTYKTKGTLQSHTITHRKVKPHKCTICPKTFAERRQLLFHLRMHSGQDLEKCDQCGKKYVSKYALKAHLVRHRNSSKHICEVCGFASSSASHLIEHMRCHTGEKPFKCNVCPLGFAVKGNLKQHQKIHQGIKEFPCTLCPFASRRKDQLLAHVQLHNTNQIRKNCTMCSKTFIREVDLKNHIHRQHGMCKPHVCQFCHQEFSFNFSTHLKTHQEWRQMCTCTICNLVLSSKRSLYIHLKRHKSQKEFICNFCGFKFFDSGDLAFHIRLHTGEKPYECEICSQGFPSTKYLKRHLRWKHRKEVAADPQRQTQDKVNCGLDTANAVKSVKNDAKTGLSVTFEKISKSELRVVLTRIVFE